MQGYPDRALMLSEQGLTLAQALDHPFSLSFVLSFSSCGLRLFRDEPQQIESFINLLERIVADNELVVTQAWTKICRGWQQILLGQYQAGITQTQAGIAGWQAIDAVSGASVQAIPLIEGYGRGGQIEKGFNQIVKTLAMIQKTGERLVEAEIYRLKGEQMLRQDEANRRLEAEACFLQAIEISREQQAKMWELRATMSLTRLWQQSGRGEEARSMLADIYNWFTESFDTPDLQAAKALLEELTPDSE